MALPIPNDWNEVDYCQLIAQVPDSPKWRGIVKGILYDLSVYSIWDSQTGNRDDAALVGFDIFDSIAFDCGGTSPIIPINIHYGYVLSSSGNEYQISSQPVGSNHRIRIRFNYYQDEGYESGSYAVTVQPDEDYNPVNPNWNVIFRTKSGVPISPFDQYSFVDFCDTNLGRVDMETTAPFTCQIIVGDPCP